MRRFFILSTFFVVFCFVEALADTDVPQCPQADLGFTVRQSIEATHRIVGGALMDVQEIKRKVKELKGEDFDETAHWCKTSWSLGYQGHELEENVWAAHNIVAVLKSHLEEIEADLKDIQARQQ